MICSWACPQKVPLQLSCCQASSSPYVTLKNKHTYNTVQKQESATTGSNVNGSAMLENEMGGSLTNCERYHSVSNPFNRYQEKAISFFQGCIPQSMVSAARFMAIGAWAYLDILLTKNRLQKWYLKCYCIYSWTMFSLYISAKIKDPAFMPRTMNLEHYAS